MKFLTNCVVAVPVLEKNKVGSIHIPDAHSRQYVGLCEALVYYIGEKFVYKKEVKVGDIILIPAQFGDPIKFHGAPENSRVYHGDDVHAVLTY